IDSSCEVIAGRPQHRNASTRHRCRERIEAKPTHVEDLHVVVLEIEVGFRLGLGAELLENPLPDLVRRRLARPAEVAVDFETYECVIHVDVLAHELKCEGVVPRSRAIAAHETQRFGLAEMDADIKDDARGAHALAVEEAQQDPWIVHVSEVLHEPLGVERPAFRVPRGAARSARSRWLSKQPRQSTGSSMYPSSCMSRSA